MVKITKKTARRRAAFTLVEIIVTIIIVATLAALSLPRFMRSYYRGILTNLRDQLTAVHAANEVYRAQTKEYLLRGTPQVCGQTALNVIKNGLKIEILSAHPATNYCYTPSANGYEVWATISIDATRTARVSVNEQPIGPNNPACLEGPTSTGLCPWGGS